MKTWKKTLMLAGLLMPMLVCAQNGYQYIPILNGRVYAVQKENTGKRGVLKNKLYAGISDEEAKKLVVVPVAYDDILSVPIVDFNGQQASEIAFNGQLNNTYTLYDLEGHKLTEPQTNKFGWLARALGSRLNFVSVARTDGKGYDLMIVMDWPNLNTTVTGPFDNAFYIKVEIGGKEYYVIKARKSGTNEEVMYDALGSPLTAENLLHLDQYYEKKAAQLAVDFTNEVKKGGQISRETERKSYQAASLGNADAIEWVTKGYFEHKQYGRVLEWGFGPALNAKCGKAAFYAAQCYRMGWGTDIRISSAKYLYEKSQSFGCAEAAAGLLAIKKIEEPIVLKTGTQPKVDDMIDLEQLEKMAKGGNLDAICTYCHQRTFFSFGSALVDYYEDIDAGDLIDDKLAVDVLPLLLAAAPKDANCQLMLACVYAGREAVGRERSYTYSFRNPQKAKYWIEKFRTNPGRKNAHGWGYKAEQIEQIIQNIQKMQ